MQRVPVRELNQHTADVLARVERGERVEITRNGVPVAVIEPARPNPLTALVESGELRLAETELAIDTSEHDGRGDAAGLAAILDDRDCGGRW